MEENSSPGKDAEPFLEKAPLPERDEVEELYWLEVLKAQEAAYKTAVEGFRDLDTKAQGTVAIAGVFLAAIFAILRQGPIAALDVKAAISVSVVSLIGAVLLAIRALGVRKVDKPPSAARVREMVKDIFTDPVSAPVRIAGFYGDRASLWSEATGSWEDSATKKAHFVKWAQFGLAVAVLATGVSVVLELLKGP